MPSTATQSVQPPRSPKPASSKVNGEGMSWKDFQKKYLHREDGYKYEWLNGVVEKTKRTMDKTQLYILRNLSAFFRQLLNTGKVQGELIAEPDLFFLENHRRPDICWLTNEQIDRMAYGENDVPAFVIEVISSNDYLNRVEKKMDNYRDAGVQVVWQVFPDYEKVHVYTGNALDSMTIRSGSQTCSAAPVLPDFILPVKDIFFKPPKP